MTSTVSFYSGSATVSPGASRTALQGQLSRYEKERSACVNCSSATTLEGKKGIQDLDSKIRATQAELQAVEATASTASSDEPLTSTVARQLSVGVYA